MQSIEEKRAYDREWRRKWREKEGSSLIQAERYKKWYSKNGRKRASNYQDILILWAKNNPEKVKARMAVARAIKSGILNKPEICSVCNKKNKHIIGHHKDYDKKLDVLWVCSSCHKRIHLGLIDI